MDNDYYGDWANQIILGQFHVTLSPTDFAEENEVEQ